MENKLFRFTDIFKETLWGGHRILPFKGIPADGRTIVRGRHLLSLKDMCRADYIGQLAEAGVTSFKIEGRLKDITYVKNVTAAYSQRLDELVARRDFNRPMADSLAAFIVEMHSKGVLHGDMNFGNFLYRRDPAGGYAFTVIDTNRSRFRDGWPTRGECIANMRTMTHRRDVYSYIVRRYAALRGWDEDLTLAEALACLDRFERKHRRKDKMKKFFKS